MKKVDDEKPEEIQGEAIQEQNQDQGVQNEESEEQGKPDEDSERKPIEGESRKKQIELKNFELQKVKILDGGVEVSFIEKDTQRPHSIGSKDLPHPDLIKAMDSLKLYVADELGLLDGWDYALNNLLSLEKVEESKGVTKGHDQAIANVNISGFSYTGSESNPGIKITGYLKCKTGGFGFSTPNIHFNGTKLGTEDVIKEYAEEIVKEVWLHFFKNKKANPNLLDQIDEAEEVEKKPKKPRKPGKQMDITDPDAMI